MNAFQIIAAILTFAALGGYINHKYLGFPTTIGNMLVALLVSLTAVSLHKFGYIDLTFAQDIVSRIDFSEVLLHGMLSFLLFAGALHVNLDDLKTVRLPVAILSTLGVVIATFVTGTAIWYGAAMVGIAMPYIYCLVFGALISPTDPIAALAVLKQANVSKNLYFKIGGESLFNDGMGIVVFMTLLGIATGASQPNAAEIGLNLLHEGVGAIVLGLLLGYVVMRFLATIDQYKVEIMLTLALVAGGNALAEYLHVSGPICMVTAGLVIGNHGRKHLMSDTTREHLDAFWELVDEILNAILFMLIGLYMIVIPITQNDLVLGFLAIITVLLGRWVSVSLPITLLSFRRKFERGTIRLMTWGGLRGGISIALALSLPESPEKSIIVPVTYIVVLFSILVQGLTFKRVIRLVLGPQK
ncbi:MAG: NhaP-type Na+(K+)/H+ antiporter [Micavibrio sp.]|nr:NhaP-type Na+(K+)/H+ antiporter [Micavibrio sp.]